MELIMKVHKGTTPSFTSVVPLMGLTQQLFAHDVPLARHHLPGRPMSPEGFWCSPLAPHIW